jgi:hypothetical protein
LNRFFIFATKHEPYDLVFYELRLTKINSPTSLLNVL